MKLAWHLKTVWDKGSENKHEQACLHVLSSVAIDLCVPGMKADESFLEKFSSSGDQCTGGVWRPLELKQFTTNLSRYLPHLSDIHKKKNGQNQKMHILIPYLYLFTLRFASNLDSIQIL